MIRISVRLTKKLFLSNLSLNRSFYKSIIAKEKITELVPALGESITEGSIAKWSKNIGDKIEVDDVIVIVETDKVTVDIKSTLSGILTNKFASDTVCYYRNEFYYISIDNRL